MIPSVMTYSDLSDADDVEYDRNNDDMMEKILNYIINFYRMKKSMYY